MKTKVRLEVLRKGGNGLSEIKLHYRGKSTFMRGSSLGNFPTLRDSFIRHLADEFAAETDAAIAKAEGR